MSKYNVPGSEDVLGAFNVTVMSNDFPAFCTWTDSAPLLGEFLAKFRWCFAPRATEVSNKNRVIGSPAPFFVK